MTNKQPINELQIMKNSIKLNFEYYIANQDKLVEQYDGKYLIIKDCLVVEVSDTMIQALNLAEDKYQEGEYIIQHCFAGKNSYTQNFRSRVTFA